MFYKVRRNKMKNIAGCVPPDSLLTDTFNLESEPKERPNKAEIPNLQKKFNINRAEPFLEQTPRHQVKIDLFYLNKYEVTNNEE